MQLTSPAGGSGGVAPSDQHSGGAALRRRAVRV